MNTGLTVTVFYLDHNNKSTNMKIQSTNAPETVERIITRGLQFVSEETKRAVVIPVHRITKIEY